jgi:hypothetical protein
MATSEYAYAYAKGATGATGAIGAISLIGASATAEVARKFELIKTLRLELKMILDELTQKIAALHHLYLDMVKTHEEQNYTFGLDSFFFQNKLIQMEYVNMQKIFAAVDNRMYCEYYKLYQLMWDYINADLKDTRVYSKLHCLKKTFPVYKDLEPFKAYAFELTTEVQEDLLEIIRVLEEHLSAKTAELSKDKCQSERGLHIENIVNVQQFQAALIHERITMFLRYLETFHAHHNKYWCRLTLKSKLIIGIVNEDIRLKQCLGEPDTPPAMSPAPAPGPAQAKAPNAGLANATGAGLALSITESPFLNQKVLARKPSVMNLSEEAAIKHLVQYAQAPNTVQSTLDTIIEHSA